MVFVIVLLELFFAFASFVAKFSPIIVLASFALVGIGFWRDRRQSKQVRVVDERAAQRRPEEHIVEVEQAKEAQKQCLEDLLSMSGELTTLTHSLCGTDEFTEALVEEACVKKGGDYQKPMPMEGCQDLYSEGIALQKVLSQCVRSLHEGRPLDLDRDFYRQWVSSLHERYNQWWWRRRTKTELEQLQNRLQRLENQVCQAHGVKRMPDLLVLKRVWSNQGRIHAVTINTYQEIYQACREARQSLTYYLIMLKQNATEMYRYIEQVRMRVEYLEQCHRFLEGDDDLFKASTQMIVKMEAMECWRNVVEYTLDTSSEILQQFLTESTGKYLKGYAQSKRSLLKKGPCGQNEAFNGFKTSLIHWACRQALLLVLGSRVDQREEDFTHPNTVDYYAVLFEEALRVKCEVELQTLQSSLNAFHKGVELSSENFLL